MSGTVCMWRSPNIISEERRLLLEDHPKGSVQQPVLFCPHPTNYDKVGVHGIHGTWNNKVLFRPGHLKPAGGGCFKWNHHILGSWVRGGRRLEGILNPDSKKKLHGKEKHSEYGHASWPPGSDQTLTFA